MAWHGASDSTAEMSVTVTERRMTTTGAIPALLETCFYFLSSPAEMCSDEQGSADLYNLLTPLLKLPITAGAVTRTNPTALSRPLSHTSPGGPAPSSANYFLSFLQRL